jgi:hypothetical protein
MATKASAEFLNEVRKLCANGTSYDAAWKTVQMTHPHLLRQMHRPGLIGPAREAATAKLRIQFANDSAAAAIGSNLVGSMPRALADALAITPDDSDDVVKTKIVQNAPALDTNLSQTLWQWIIDCVKRSTGSAMAAQAKAQTLFPQLLQLCGTAS